MAPYSSFLLCLENDPSSVALAFCSHSKGHQMLIRFCSGARAQSWQIWALSWGLFSSCYVLSLYSMINRVFYFLFSLFQLCCASSWRKRNLFPVANSMATMWLLVVYHHQTTMYYWIGSTVTTSKTHQPNQVRNCDSNHSWPIWNRHIKNRQHCPVSNLRQLLVLPHI